MKSKAMILCAGFGTRMQEFTQNCPKPMLPLNDRPLLEYTILNLKKAGIVDIAMNVHYLADHITDYFADGSKLGVSISYCYEDAPSGTAGGVKKMEQFLEDADQFLVLYGDIITNQNFSALIDFHKTSNALASIILHRRKKSNSVVLMNEKGRIDTFLERPDEETRKKYDLSDGSWVNSGLYCFAPEVLQLIPKDSFCDFPKDIFPKIISESGLYGMPLTGYRCAIDTPNRYEEAIEHFDNNKNFLG